MRWQECFQKYSYTPLIYMNDSGERRTDLENFCIGDKVPDELRQIYLSKCEDEMFLVLCLSNEEDVKKFCYTWDNRIMAFINFCKWKSKTEIKKLQYNITQILLYEDHVEKQLEKSVTVSRKIFIKCNGIDELDDDNRMLLPFWLDELKSAKINVKEEQELCDLLPMDESLAFMRKKRRS